MTIVTFLFFTGLVGFLTYLLTRKDDHGTSTGYFLAGRTLTGGFIAGSLLLTNLSTEQLVGLNGAAFTDGIAVMAWEVIAGASLVLMALYFLPKYLRSGIATIPQFLEERFNGTTRSITSFIFIIAYAGILLPIILYTGATGLMGILDLKSITGIESEKTLLWITVWFIGIVGSIYAIFGGLRTVAVSDTINGFGLLVGGIAIALFGLNALGDGGIVQNFSELREANPEKFNSIGGKDSSVPFSTLFTGVLLLNLFYWTTNQQIIQRTFGASSLKEGQKGVLIAGVFKVLAPIILVLPGIIAFAMFGHLLIDGEKVQIKDATTEAIAFVGMSGDDEVILHGKDAAKALGTDDPAVGAAKEGTMITVDDKEIRVDKVLAEGVAIIAGAEGGGNTYIESADLDDRVFPRRADKAYGTLVNAVLPKWLAGFFAAVMVGAILSSFNSALNSTATLFSLGVYKHYIKHDEVNEQKVINNGKLVGAIAAVLAMCTAPQLFGQESIFGYLQKMNGLYFIPIFSVVLAGFLFRRATARAANIALAGGCGMLILGYFVPPFSGWAEKVHGFHFLGIVFGVLMIFQFIMSKVSPLTQPWEHKHSGDVDLTPWKWAKPIGFGIVAFVVVLYLAFADFSILKG